MIFMACNPSPSSSRHRIAIPRAQLCPGEARHRGNKTAVAYAMPPSPIIDNDEAVTPAVNIFSNLSDHHQEACR